MFFQISVSLSFSASLYCIFHLSRILALFACSTHTENISQLIISAIKSFYDKLLQSRMSEKTLCMRRQWKAKQKQIEKKRRGGKKMLINWNKINNNKWQICCYYTLSPSPSLCLLLSFLLVLNEIKTCVHDASQSLSASGKRGGERERRVRHNNSRWHCYLELSRSGCHLILSSSLHV